MLQPPAGRATGCCALANKGYSRSRPPAEPFSLAAFQTKLQEIQSRLPKWLWRSGRQREGEALMRRLERATKTGNLAAADAAASEALRLMAP